MSNQTILYFLALRDFQIAMDRVSERVEYGGHYVSKPTIRDRYEKGLKLLDLEAINFFDVMYMMHPILSISNLSLKERRLSAKAPILKRE